MLCTVRPPSFPTRSRLAATAILALPCGATADSLFVARGIYPEVLTDETFLRRQFRDFRPSLHKRHDFASRLTQFIFYQTFQYVKCLGWKTQRGQILKKLAPARRPLWIVRRPTPRVVAKR